VRSSCQPPDSLDVTGHQVCCCEDDSGASALHGGACGGALTQQGICVPCGAGDRPKPSLTVQRVTVPAHTATVSAPAMAAGELHSEQWHTCSRPGRQVAQPGHGTADCAAPSRPHADWVDRPDDRLASGQTFCNGAAGCGTGKAPLCCVASPVLPHVANGSVTSPARLGASPAGAAAAGAGAGNHGPEDTEGPVGGGGLTCVVCLEEVAAGEQLTTLPCLHRFHPDCVRPWLRQQGRHGAACPLCKAAVFVQPVGASGRAGNLGLAV
jgi:hypothetical protein